MSKPVQEEKKKDSLTFPGYVIPPMDEESISTLVLKDRGQNLCDEPRERVLRGLVQVLHLIGHIGVVRLQI